VACRFWRFALALFLLLSIPAVSAQQRPVFQATVAQVRVDVIVTDGDGNFIRNLSLEDFTLYEDDEAQEILSVQLVDLSEGTVLRLGQPAVPVAVAAEGVAADPAPTTEHAPTAAPLATEEVPGAATEADLAATDLGAVIYIIDGPSISEMTKNRFTLAWSSLLDQTERLSVPHAAYMISGVGRIEELSPLTMNMERMREAVRKLENEPLLDLSLQRRLVDFYNYMAAEQSLTAGIAGEDGGGASPQGNEPVSAAVAEAQAEEQRELARSLYTLEILTSFCDALAARGGRTALVWVTTGVKTTQGGPFTILASNEDRASLTLGIPDPRAMKQMERLQHAANSSSVSIYAIDPTPINQVRGMAVDAGIQTVSEADFASGRSGSARLSSIEMDYAVTGLRDGMIDAAAETGGQAIIGATDLAEAVQTIESDTGRFYLVTYAAPLPEGDGEYHEIRVEVRRPDADVRARKGYVDLAVEEAQQRLVMAALALPGTVTGLPVHAEAFRIWGWGERKTLVLATSIEAWKVNTGFRADGTLGASLRVHVTVTDQDGELIERADDDLSARARAQDLTSEAGDQPGAGMVVYRNGWMLDPGTYDVHVALLDEIAGEIGATSLEVEIPEVEEGWRTSDLMLVTTDSSIYAYPIPNGRFVAGQKVGAYIEVKDGKQPLIGGRLLEAQRGGAEGSDQAMPRTLRVLPAQRLSTKGPATYSGSLQLPENLTPGKYTLEIVVSDQAAGEERTFLVPIEVLRPHYAADGVSIGSS